MDDFLFQRIQRVHYLLRPCSKLHLEHSPARSHSYLSQHLYNEENLDPRQEH